MVLSHTVLTSVGLCDSKRLIKRKRDALLYFRCFLRNSMRSLHEKANSLSSAHAVGGFLFLSLTLSLSLSSSALFLCAGVQDVRVTVLRPRDGKENLTGRRLASRVRCRVRLASPLFLLPSASLCLIVVCANRVKEKQPAEFPSVYRSEPSGAKKLIEATDYASARFR